MSKGIELHALRYSVKEASETISQTGVGLCAIAEVLGSDGDDYELTDNTKSGLICAVRAIGALMIENGHYLWNLASKEGK
ncbi:hypothetical protein AX279_22465 [Pseudomonas sp. J237]|nr:MULTISPECIES: hypothetical protein [Pseudomonas]OEO23092.1 hypothetical protein AX279_22465 [Pseudomonas sp. J237]